MPGKPIPLDAPRDGAVVRLWSLRSPGLGSWLARWDAGAWRSLCRSKAFADDARYIGWSAP